MRNSNCTNKSIVLQCKFNKAFSLTLSVLLALSVSANTYNVTTTSDSPITGAGISVNNTNGVITGGSGNGFVTFRSALKAANGLGGTHTVNVPAGTYNLTLGMITMNDIAENITISGAGAATTIVNMTATLQDRILLVGTSGLQANMIMTINNMQFTGGKLNADNYGGGAIIAGGPGNSLTLTNCIFQNNTISASQSGAGGGAVRYNGGGTLTITGCTFNNNSDPVGEGGAVNYFLENVSGTGNGALSITNSTFTNNSVTGGGGALAIAAAGRITAGITFTVDVSKNSFSGNSATTGGGAITITNSFDVGNTCQIHYNRIVSNTSTAGASGLQQSGGSQGNVDATNNWWGCNTGPTAGTCNKAIKGSGGGTQDVSTWLQLKTTSSSSSICSVSPINTSVITADFLTNSASAAIAASNLTAFTGVAVSFAGTLGATSGAQTTIQSTGTATATFTSSGTAGAASASATVDGFAVSSPTITVTTATLPTGTTNVTQTAGTNSNTYNTGCQVLASAIPQGADPITGSVTTTVWIEGAVPTQAGKPFVARHYQISPGGGTMARVTLYFTQAEFTAFNSAAGSTLDLPSAAGDATGKANLRVAKYSGSSSGGGLPASYSGAVSIIDPLDVDIVFEASNRWAVTFDVTGGFSGFIVQTYLFVLPVRLVSFSGHLTADKKASLTWNVADQQGIQKYTVEKSTDGRNYIVAGTVAANGSTVYSYHFEDMQTMPGITYYRLKITDYDGKETYSSVVKIDVKANLSAMVYPNPANDKLTVQRFTNSTATVAQLTDINGKLLQTTMLRDQQQTINISKYPAGLYLLKLDDGSVFKVNKQ